MRALVQPAPSQCKHKMQRRAAFEVVFRGCFVVDHLFPTKDQALLDGWNAFFLFYFFFDLRDLVVALDVELDLFPGQCPHLDQHRGWSSMT